jgi:hypothetical protein
MQKKFWNILLDTYTVTGQIEPVFLATTGSSTTLVTNTLLSNLITPKLKDYARDYVMFCESDAGGANAAPEGEFSRITAYTTTTYGYTVETAFSQAIATGDRMVIARTKVLPFHNLKLLVAHALENMGRIELTDVSLTTGDEQTEYDLPLGITRDSLKRVQIEMETDANDHNPLDIDFEVISAAPGSKNVLQIPQYDSGYVIRLTYKDYHPRLTSYSSVLAESIDYPLLKKQLEFDAIDFINKDSEGGSKYWLMADQRANAALQQAKAEHPFPRTKRRNNILSLRDIDDSSNS